MSSPYEVQLAPADIYYAPLGEPFPDVSAVPAGNWLELALATHITEAGIIVSGAVTDAMIRSLGTVAPSKAGVVQRDFLMEFEVMNATAAQIALANGGDPASVVTAAAGGGHPGTKKISIPASPVPVGWAILLRWGQSASGDGFNSQYEIKSAVQIGDGGGTFSKSAPFGQKYKLAALYTDAAWVKFVQQTAASS